MTCLEFYLFYLTFYFVADADINSRDHSGKKPRQVAREGLTIEAQGKHVNYLILCDNPLSSFINIPILHTDLYTFL